MRYFIIIGVILYLLLDIACSEEPSWVSEYRKGNVVSRVEENATIHFRHISECSKVVKECEDNIVKAFPEKMNIPHTIELFYQSPKGDCAVSIAINRRDLENAPRLPEKYIELMDSKEEYFRRVKSLKKYTSLVEMDALKKSNLKYDEHDEIEMAFGIEMCYNKFEYNASLTNKYYIFCINSFYYHRALILGIYDHINHVWILE